MQELRNYSFSFQELDITSDMVGEVMGYPAGQVPEPFPGMISSALERGTELCHILGSIVVSSDFKIDIEGGIFSFENQVFEVDSKMLEQLIPSEGAAIFICTAGSDIGEESRKLLAAENFMEGYILDVIGSVTVEAAIDKIQAKLVTELEEKGLNTTNRYSPGYCGWALSEQKKLFSLFPHGHCGITLTDSYLMEPAKSVSGIIGFGSKTRKHLHECQLCELETCIYRKIRMSRQSNMT